MRFADLWIWDNQYYQAMISGDPSNHSWYVFWQWLITGCSDRDYLSLLPYGPRQLPWPPFTSTDPGEWRQLGGNSEQITVLGGPGRSSQLGQLQFGNSPRCCAKLSGPSFISILRVVVVSSNPNHWKPLLTFVDLCFCWSTITLIHYYS